MIIIGGEPPFVENPEPGFDGVIKKLNELTEVAQDRANGYNTNVKKQIDDLNAFIDTYVATTLPIAEAHLAARGAVHGENRATVGLGKVDNFRVATIAEQIAFANINAFVTPAGARQAIVKNNAAFSADSLQKNDVFQIATFYIPDEYPVVAPTVKDPTLYYSLNSPVNLMINGDRIVYQPKVGAGGYSRLDLWQGLATKSSGVTKLSQIVNINANYNCGGWNQVGADDSLSGNVMLFKALADKKIYQFKNGLGLTPGNRAYLPYKTFGSKTWKGLAVCAVASLVNNDVNMLLDLRAYYVNNPATDPTMVPLVDGTYPAILDLMNSSFNGQFNGSHSYKVADFVTLPAGAVVTQLAAGSHPFVTLLWSTQDLQAYLHVCLAVKVTLNGVSKNFVFECMESITPGTLNAGGVGAIKTLGSRTKDVLDTNLNLKAGATFLKVYDVRDMANLSVNPGLVLNSGDLVKAVSTKYGIRTKRYTTQLKGLKAFLLGTRPAVDAKLALTEVYAPSRHRSLGAIPERIIPVTSSAASVGYLVYAIDPSNGRYEWRDVSWASALPVGVVNGAKFGFSPPDQTTENKTIGNLPASVVVTVNAGAVGVGLGAMAFTTSNGYKGFASVSYSNDRVVTTGAPMTLDGGSLNSLFGALSGVNKRAIATFPTVDNTLRKLQVQVFAVDAARALVFMSDGINYAEAGVLPYTVSGSLFKLTNPASIKLSRVTGANAAVPTGKFRQSQSSDDVWMQYSDLQICRSTADTMTFVVTRAFGDLYGDVAFAVNGFTTEPVFYPYITNSAKLYAGTAQFDCVDEMYPPVLIPGKGHYVHDPANTGVTTNLRQVPLSGGASASFVDPYEVNEAGWVNLPAGARVVLSGRTYILDKDYPVKVGTSGVRYCYLSKVGSDVIAIASAARREPANNEVIFGVATNGILELSKDFIIMYNHQVSATRQGSAIPVFNDDGGNGVNQFFTRRDVK